MTDREWRITYLNSAAERLLIRSREDLLGRNLWEEFPEATALSFYREYQRAMRDQVPAIFEEFYPPLKIWIEVRAFPSAEGLTVYVRDVTAQRAANKAIRDSETRLQLVAKATSDALWEWNLEDGSGWWGEGLRKLFGWDPAEMEPGWISWVSRVHPDDLRSSMESIQAAIDGGAETWLGEFRFRRKDGCYADALSRVYIERDATGKPVRVVGATSDISESKRVERQLRQQAYLLDDAADAIIVRDMDSRVLYWNKGAERLYGWKAEEVMGTMQSAEMVSDPAAVEALTAVKRDGYWTGELTRTTRDGRNVTIRTRLTLGRDEAGNPSTILSISTDITDIKQAEMQLRHQASLLDKATDAIVVRDLNYRLKFWNKGAERLYGWKAEEVLGNDDPQLLYRDGLIGPQIGRETLEKGEWFGELHQIDRHGKDVVVQARLSLLRDESGQPNGVLAISTDIRQRLEMEKRLLQSQKLEAIGQLTGGIAHDFNNLLTIIAGNADMLAEALADNALNANRDELRSLAEMTRTAAERGGALTKQLLAFARRQPLQAEAVSVAELLAGMDDLLRRALGEHIELQVLDTTNSSLALIDRAQLESAILNLCINARDAMSQGGRLSIEISDVELDENFAHQHDITPGAYVMVAVADTGTGMPPEFLSRVFEPFFTTKEIGKGSGLGLSMVYGFARQSGGHVKIYSEQGYGSVVKLYLPRAAKHGGGTLVAAPTEVTRGAEHILLVEDDELVRTYVGKQLAALGYRVTEARTGQEALAMLKSNAGFDLLFTDLVMPGGINGQQLADEASNIRPELPVLFTSGYTEHASISQGRLRTGALLLSKPYRRQDLAAKIRLALDQVAGTEGVH